ncbi:polysaccharide pyruvyl transferase family protein [Aliivibrio fischeri]|uniref:polysaccharide pyruvyl transferase family protein n=1 Tax=Aliivibrio fischeri TaxID=668 RepID=UPI0007C5CC57|nr:polysaccharide pyruvyl transferase family protein [Aliivibrio fischeri]
MKKKVGIITFHNAHNYGAVLQAYALSKKISSYGFEVEFIKSDLSYIQNHYKRHPFIKDKKISFIQYAKNIVHYILDFKRINKRYSSFERFIKKNFNEVNITHKKSEFDFVILGSDQIWNSNITNKFDPIFFGVDDNILAKKVISYAASMGNATQSKNLTKDFDRLIANVNSIGVREYELKSILNKKYDFDVNLNLDPTLLLDKMMWGNGNIKTKNNIVIYEVYNSKESILISEYLKSRFNLDVKIISSGSPSILVSNEIITTASPDDFIDLLSSASFIITTSFHGTVFSIINNVPFYTVKINDGVDKRSANLLEQLGLSDRHVLNLDEAKSIDTTINFSEANSKLKELQDISDAFLRKELDV